MEWTGINNENEYYSAYFLSEGLALRPFVPLGKPLQALLEHYCIIRRDSRSGKIRLQPTR